MRFSFIIAEDVASGERSAAVFGHDVVHCPARGACEAIGRSMVREIARIRTDIAGKYRWPAAMIGTLVALGVAAPYAFVWPGRGSGSIGTLHAAVLRGAHPDVWLCLAAARPDRDDPRPLRGVPRRSLHRLTIP